MSNKKRIEVKPLVPFHTGIFPVSIDWDELEENGTVERVGYVSVDSASIKITIDDMDFSQCVFEVFTPDGDGGYSILAAYVHGVGRCLLVAFDTEENRHG